MVRVRVITTFTHEGRAFNAGETMDVSPVVAAVLHRQGYVSLTKQYGTKAQTAETATETPPRRRAYRRRDLVAE